MRIGVFAGVHSELLLEVAELVQAAKHREQR